MNILAIADKFIEKDIMEKGLKLFKENGHTLVVREWHHKDIEALQYDNLIIEQKGANAIELPNDLISDVENYDLIIVQFAPIGKEVIKKANKLKYIGVLRGGIENVDIDEAKNRGIEVLNTAGRNARAVAEFTVGMILSEIRNIARAHSSLKNGIFNNTIFNTNLTKHPIPNAVAGTITFPNPCNAPFIVWSNIENITDTDISCNNSAPSFAFGYNKFNIGCAKTIIPTTHGNPINIEVSNENDVLLVAVSLSFFAFAADIAGTNAVANAIFMASGKFVTVSTFPLNCPYNFVAISAGIYVLKILFTVKESIFLLNDVIIELSVNGIETINIFFTIVFTFSYL